MSVVYIFQLVIGVKRAVLDDERQVILASRQIELCLFLVVDDQQSSQSVIRLAARLLMGVRMIPVRSRPILHRKFVDVLFIGLHDIAWMTVHLLWNMLAVPVDNCFGGQLVDERDAHFLSLPQADCWAQIAVGEFC